MRQHVAILTLKRSAAEERNNKWQKNTSLDFIKRNEESEKEHKIFATYAKYIAPGHQASVKISKETRMEVLK